MLRAAKCSTVCAGQMHLTWLNVQNKSHRYRTDVTKSCSCQAAIAPYMQRAHYLLMMYTLETLAQDTVCACTGVAAAPADQPQPLPEPVPEPLSNGHGPTAPANCNQSDDDDLYSPCVMDGITPSATKPVEIAMPQGKANGVHMDGSLAEGHQELQESSTAPEAVQQ